MTKLVSQFIIFTVCLILVACGSPADIPNSRSLSNQITQYISSYHDTDSEDQVFAISNVKIVSQENIGNTVDEKYVGRFIATVKNEIPLYEGVRRNQVGNQLIKEVHRKGSSNEISGKFTAIVETLTSDGKTWGYRIEMDDTDSMLTSGSPLYSFKNPLTIGSVDEKIVTQRIDSRSKFFEQNIGSYNHHDFTPVTVTDLTSYYADWEVFAYAGKGRSFSKPNWLESITIKSDNTYSTETGKIGAWEKSPDSTSLILTLGQSKNIVWVARDTLHLVDKSGGKYLYYKK